MGSALGHHVLHRPAPPGATLKNVLEEHPKVATVGVVLIAVAVILLLWILSTQPPTPGTKNEIVAHSNNGPVIPPASSTRPYAQGIEDVDFPSLLQDETSGGRKLEDVVYTDIDGSGREEAVALIRGTGESNPLSWRLYGLKNGTVTVLYERTDIAQGELKVDGPRIVESEGLYAEGDQPCCPSAVTRTFYVWKGDSLVVSHVESAPPGA